MRTYDIAELKRLGFAVLSKRKSTVEVRYDKVNPIKIGKGKWIHFGEKAILPIDKVEGSEQLEFPNEQD